MFEETGEHGSLDLRDLTGTSIARGRSEDGTTK